MVVLVGVDVIAAEGVSDASDEAATVGTFVVDDVVAIKGVSDGSDDIATI